jgi:hypothetical protein
MLPTALISRPDHNAPFPREVHVCAPAEPIGDLTGGHHVIARQLAEPQARSSPPARKGRSKAEWLDRAEDRRQSRVVMAALLSDGDAQRENEREERDAQGWEIVGGDGAVPSQAEIQGECAFTYMNAVFRKNLTDALAVDANDVDTASDSGSALNDGRDRARFCRTNATCIWGVSDPRFSGRRTSTGGWQRGSLTPYASITASDSRADCDARGTKRRPFHPGRSRSLAKTSTNRSEVNHAHAAARFDGEPRAQKGEHSSRVCVPPAREVQRSATSG